MIDLIQRGVNLRRLSLDGTSELREDVVARDAPVCIFVNDEPFRTLIASPEMLEELAIGHLFTEGVISNHGDVKSLTVKPLRIDVTLRFSVDLNEVLLGKSRLLTTACGLDSRIQDAELKRLKVSPVENVDASLVSELIRTLNERSKVFRKTGGTHSALLYVEGKDIICFAEDVGRHNALDKVIGYGLRAGVDFSKCTLVSSGRLSGEMVLKAARASIPLICSVSAPLLSGLKIAEETGVTVVGFVRGRRMNHYLELDQD
ncbi:MAG: formate dehydrogenase accessory sulfurtransferase FdhD [Candidatus Bathyarchaeota archaeon]|nr:formate dehydrogenase accessory sulfurtransferase FdhD [Candidatus Bathyarchaeota archaeon]